MTLSQSAWINWHCAWLIPTYPPLAGGREGGLNASTSRLLVVLGSGAAAEVLEEHGFAAEGASSYFSNSVAEMFLEDGATLTHG